MTDGTREKMLQAALRLLASDGPESLQARKLAAEVGASTMAVYTHFGGMQELLDALVREGFVWLDQRLARVPHTEDPLADLLRLGLAYRDHALEHPHLYRLMFGLAGAGGGRGSRDITVEGSPTDKPEGQASFAHLATGVARVVEAGTIPELDATAGAAQLWSAVHGYVLLEIAGYFGADGHGVAPVLEPLAMNVLIGMGASPEQVRHSAEHARS